MFRTFAFETSEATFAFETSEATFETSESARRAKRTYTHLYTPRPRADKLPRYWLAKKSKSGKETLSKWRRAREISLNINRSTITIRMGLYARSIINFKWNFGNLNSMAGEKRLANTDAIKHAESRQAAQKRSNGGQNQGPVTVQEHDRAETQWQWQDIAEQMGIENKFYKNIGLSAPLSRMLAKKWDNNVLFEKLTEQVLLSILRTAPPRQFQPNEITNFVTNKDLVLKKLDSKEEVEFAAGCSGTIVKLKKQGNVRKLYGKRRIGKVQFVVFMENEEKAKFLINPNDLFAPFIKAMAYGLFMKIFEIIPSANFEETIKYNEIFSDWRRKYDINYRRKEYGNNGHQNEEKAKFLINPNDLFAPFIKAMAYGLFMKIFEIIPSANFEETIKYNDIFSDWRRKYDINYRRKQYGKGHQYSAVEIAST